MSFDETTFQFTIPLSPEQAQEAIGLIDQYDRALKEAVDNDELDEAIDPTLVAREKLSWGNAGLHECFGNGQDSCLTGVATDGGLQISWDTEADLEVAKTMAESLLDRFDIDTPVIFRYGNATARGRESSGGTILAHRNPEQSQWSNARDLEDLMKAGVNVEKLLSEALRLAQQNMVVPSLIRATNVLSTIAGRTTEEEHRRAKAIEKGAETEEDVTAWNEAITLPFEYWEGRTEDADCDIEAARRLLRIKIEPIPLPKPDDSDETDEPGTPGPSM